MILQLVNIYMFKPEHYKCGVIKLEEIKNSSNCWYKRRLGKNKKYYEGNPLNIIWFKNRIFWECLMAKRLVLKMTWTKELQILKALQ